MNDKIREEFEAASAQRFRDEGYSELDIPSMFERNKNGEYSATRVRGAWWGWVQSRAALVVELPEPHMCTNCGDVDPWDGDEVLRDMYDIYLESDVRKALTKAGVTVK